MAQVIVDDPEYVRHRTVDGDGRIYVGREYADKNVRVVFEMVGEDEDDEDHD